MTAPVMAQVERPPRINPQDWERMGAYQKARAAAAWRGETIQRQVAEIEWTPAQMASGRRAHERWAAAGKPAGGLSLLDREAYRAYKRVTEARRRAKGPVRVSTSPRAQEAAEMAAEGLSLEAAARALGVRRASLEKCLLRAVHDDGPATLDRLRENRK